MIEQASRPRDGNRQPLCEPSADQVAASALTAFTTFCERRTERRFAQYADFERWAIGHGVDFWTLFVEWSGLHCEGSASPAIAGTGVEHARFFPELKLNYAAHLLRTDAAGCEAHRPALAAVHADRAAERWTRGELRARVAALSAGLSALGFAAGERAVLLAPNTAHAAAGALAAAAIGCTLSSATADLGVFALLSRFGQVDPGLLLAELPAGDTPAARTQRERFVELVRSLHTLRAVVLLDEHPVPDGIEIPVHRASELIARHSGSEPVWPMLPFNHPLYILFTSGTTGVPKCLVHGAGGTLLEHLKEHLLHCDLKPADKLFFQTSTGWMMWNWQLSALATGCELMLYDGPVDGADALWKRVAAERVTAFGTSPAYLQLCEQSGWTPPRDGGATLDFSALRAMYSTGSVLYPRQQEWVWQQVKPVPIQSISGGTDIVGCFVLGNPNLPVYSAEPQCRSLGLDVRALNVDAAGIGELVCANPFPSRPLGLVDDADGRRFHAAYFAQHPGVWTHGDLVEFTAEGSARMHGRSDGVLNIRGIRIGPAEIYRMLADVPEITEAMAIERHADDEPGNARLVLLLVLRQGAALDAELSARIRRLLAQRGSPAHVPAAILAVDQLPTTHSGKRSERSARDALNGRAVVNSAALRNPESLEPLRAWAAQVRPERTVTVPAPAVAEPLAETVARVWREVLDLPAVKPSDNYFDLGGDSLRALKILEVLRRATGREVPLTLLLDAPTLAGFVQALGATAEHEYRPLVQLQAPRDPDVEPLFIVHGVGGSAMELLGLARLIDDGRAVYGIQARGFDAQDTPSRDVHAMACEYLAAVRGVQPEGPYLLAGYSFGGQVAYEMARQLQEAGDEVGLVALLDTGVPERHWPPAAWFEYFLRRVRIGVRSLRARRAHEWPAVLQGLLRSLRHRVHRRALPPQRLADEYAAHLPETVRRVRCAGFTAALASPPRRSGLSVHLLRTDLDRSHSCDPAIVWRRCARSVTVHAVPGDHASLIRAPHAAAVARCLAECLATAAPAAAARDLQPPVPLITAEPPHLPRAGVDAAPAPALPPPPADLPASASAWLS